MKPRLWLVPAAVIGFATHASAQAADQVVMFGCQRAAAETIRVPLQAVDSVRFGVDTRVVRASSDGALVRGSGEYQSRRGSSWHPFTFDCEFDGRTGEASNVKVQFPPQDGRRAEPRREKPRIARGTG
jgi:hypothetical protein